MARRTSEDKRRAFALRSQGKTFAEIGRELGIPIGTISSWWRDKDFAATGEPSDVAQRAVPVTPPLDDAEAGQAEGRTHDRTPPVRPPDGKVAQPQQDLDYRQIADYIEGIYKTGGHLVASTDEALGMAIDKHAAHAGTAWAAWIRSEPKVAALLQRLMIGTPLGEVIGVHVSIAFTYWFTRDALITAARAAAAAEANANGGAAGSPQGTVEFDQREAA